MRKCLIGLILCTVVLWVGVAAAQPSEEPPNYANSLSIPWIGEPPKAPDGTIYLAYDDGTDDSPGSGWYLSPNWSYQVRFNPPPGTLLKVGTVEFFIADVFNPGTIEVHIQSGLDETFAAAKLKVDEPGWYKVEIVPGFETDTTFWVVLRTPDFRGGGGDDMHPPIAGRSAQGWPGTWQSRPANFMVRAVAEEAPFPGHKIAVLICGDTPFTALDAVQKGVGTWNGGIANLRLDAQMITWGYDEFWNDTVRLYHTLIEQGGFDPKNIYVLWGNGTDWNVLHPDQVAPLYVPKYGTMTDFPATLDSVRTVFRALASGNVELGIPQVTKEDSLFVWTFDHGTSSGGGGQQTGDSWVCLMDGNMSDYEFAELLHRVEYQRAAVFMQQCFSGGFIDNVADDKTFIGTACRGDESAWRADDVEPSPDRVENETWDGLVCHHGEFNYYMMNAFQWRSPLGTFVDANRSLPADRISSTESFSWAYSHDSRWETPQSRDDGRVGTRWIMTWRTYAQR